MSDSQSPERSSNDPSTAKKALTLSWSVGLAVGLIVLTGALVLPSTKSARIRVQRHDKQTEISQLTPAAQDDVALWSSKSIRVVVEEPVAKNAEPASPLDIDIDNEGPESSAP